MNDNNNLNQQVIDKMTKVCICRAMIKEAIKNGAHIVEAVAEKTGATKGSCKGCRCRDKIEELIEDNQ